MANIEYRALFQCTSGLTDLLQHNLSVSDKLLEKGLITMDVHDYILTAQGVSNQQKASRLVSCLTDRVKDAAQMFHDLVTLLKEDPFFADIVEKINIEHRTLLENNKPCDSGKDEKVVEIINMLEKQFSSMQRRLQSEMKTNSEISPETLVDSLTLLPISLRAEYQKFIFENLKTLEKAESIREIFHQLNLHFTFIDYRLLEFLIDEYGSHRLKQDMSAYTGRVQAFIDETTIQQLMDHWPGQSDIPPQFEKLRMVIDKDPRKYTLRQLDDLRKKLCSMARLSETVFILIGVGRKNSFIVCWMVPSVFDSQLKSVISSLRSFYQREHIFSVTVGRQRLYSVAAEYEERLLSLCSSGTGDISEFQYLLSQPGLDTNIYDKDGFTPLWHVSSDGRTELVKLFLEHGAEVDLPNDTEYGDTALIRACAQGHVVIAALLLEKGALVNYQNKSGASPLCKASDQGHDDVVQLLLDSGASVDPPAKISKKLVVCGQSDIVQDHHSTTKKFVHITPLMEACGAGRTHTASLLIKAGADINYQDEDGWTPLIASSSADHKDTVELLIEKKAQLNIQTKEGWIALSLASWEGHTKTVKILVQAGADVNIQGQAGLTALMLATQNGHANIVQTLLNGKADPNITDKTTGQSAIFFAATQGNTEITELLIRGGAKLDIKDNNGLTAFKVAKAHNQQAICDLLEKYGSKTTGKEITQEQKEQVKVSSQHLMNIFSFLERTLLRGRVEKREQKQSNKGQTSSNIFQRRQEKQLAKKMKGMTIHTDTTTKFVS